MVLLKKGFEPLGELKVVLVASLGQFAHFDVALDAVFVKTILKNFVIFNKFIFVLGIPLNFAVREGSRIQTVHYAAVDSTSGTLLNFG
jgi:hypothetical protein